MNPEAGALDLGEFGVGTLFEAFPDGDFVLLEETGLVCVYFDREFLELLQNRGTEGPCPDDGPTASL